MHGVDKIYVGKNEGGCGIRRLLDINKASGVRLVWRIYTKKFSLDHMDEKALSSRQAYISSYCYIT